MIRFLQFDPAGFRRTCMTLARRRTALVVLVPALLAGCGNSYTTRPTEISITQFQTNQPAAGLDVKVMYSGWLFVENVPQDVSGKTDREGKVVLPVADFKKGAVNLKVGDPWAYYLITPQVAQRGGEAIEQGEEPIHEYRIMLNPVAK